MHEPELPPTGVQLDDQPPKSDGTGETVIVTAVPSGKYPVQLVPVPQLKGGGVGAGTVVTVEAVVVAPFPTL